MIKKLLLALFFSCLSIANTVSIGHLFVIISDSMENAKNNNPSHSIPLLENFKKEFQTLNNHDSKAGKEVYKIIEAALKNPDLETLESLSSALLAFEKEQNPVDYASKIKQFQKRIIPIFTQLQQETQQKNMDTLPSTYKKFYDTWQRNERIVGDLSLGHYKQIEVAFTMYRIAMVSDPVDFDNMSAQIAKIDWALKDFISGNTLQVENVSDSPQTLAEGISLLHLALKKFPEEESEAKSLILDFISQWPIFEGEVRTRDSNLYNKVETELPQIAAKAATEENMQNLQNLIQSLESLDTNASYTALDAAIILLREGIEALLVITALLAASQATKQRSSKEFIIGGALVGVSFSLLIAITLSYLLPVATAGTNREIIEGAVGILAVILMLFIGAWLHNKSSIANWKAFIQQQVGRTITKGNLLGLGGLSFLVVFREGAETILFYAGIMPQITLESLLSGIAIALIGLIIVAYLMKVFTQKLPIHLMFGAMSWLIYIIGFKILGVSIHALQLTNILPIHILSLPSIAIFGFYNTIEGIMAQAVYLILIFVIIAWQKYSHTPIQSK